MHKFLELRGSFTLPHLQARNRAPRILHTWKKETTVAVAATKLPRCLVVSSNSFCAQSTESKKKVEESSSDSDSSDDDDDDDDTSSGSSSSSDSSDSSQEKDTSDEAGDSEEKSPTKLGEHAKVRSESGKESLSPADKKSSPGKTGAPASPSKTAKPSAPSTPSKPFLQQVGQKPKRGRPPKPKLSTLLVDKSKKLTKPKAKLPQLLPGQIKRPRGRPPKYPRNPDGSYVLGMGPPKRAPKKLGRPKKVSTPLDRPPGSTISGGGVSVVSSVSHAVPSTKVQHPTVAQALSSPIASSLLGKGGPTQLQKFQSSLSGRISSQSDSLGASAMTAIGKKQTSMYSYLNKPFSHAAPSPSANSDSSSSSSVSLPGSGNINGDVNKNVIALKSNVNSVDSHRHSKDGSSELFDSVVKDPNLESRSFVASEATSQENMELRTFWKPPPESKPLLDQVVITDVTAGSLTITIRESTSDVGFFKTREQQQQANCSEEKA